MLSLQSTNKVDDAKKIIVIVDQTVEDKNTLKRLQNKVYREFYRQLMRRELLGAEIKFAVAGSRGEIAPFCIVDVKKQVGNKRKNLVEANKKMLDCFGKALKNTVKNRKHKTSLLVEAMSSALKSADKVYFISDMAVVDSHNNHEVGKFSSPPDLSKLTMGKFVQIERISRYGQSFNRANLIDSWWEAALYGDREKFNKLVKKSKSKTHPKKKKRRYVRANEVNKAKKYLVKQKAKLFPCFKNYKGKEAEMILRVIVKNKRAVSIKVKKSGFPRKVNSCLASALRKINYKVAYAKFDQHFEYGGGR